MIDGFYMSKTWSTLTTRTCPSDTSLYFGNEVTIDFNRSFMDSNSAFKKKIGAMHEIGHAYGLDHVSAGCRLMRGSLDVITTCGTMPTSDDEDGADARYPYRGGS